MATTSGRLLLWSPRILGILVSMFIGMFALDAFSEGKPFLLALPDFIIHLIPGFVLLGLVVASFRQPWIGPCPSSASPSCTR
jgi:F0F1-type ATP synthase assembly protein I